MNVRTGQYGSEAEQRSEYLHLLRRWRMGDHLTGRWEGLTFYLDWFNPLARMPDISLRWYDSFFLRHVARFEELTYNQRPEGPAYTYKGSASGAVKKETA